MDATTLMMLKNIMVKERKEMSECTQVLLPLLLQPKRGKTNLEW
jgi:hypothetical protein